MRGTDLGAPGDTTAVQRPNDFAQQLASRVERVIVYGLESAPSKVVVHDGHARDAKFTYIPAQKRRATRDDSSELVAATLVVHDPGPRIASDWDIEIV